LDTGVCLLCQNERERERERENQHLRGGWLVVGWFVYKDVGDY
jgi:hypothetical protein